MRNWPEIWSIRFFPLRYPSDLEDCCRDIMVHSAHGDEDSESEAYAGIIGGDLAVDMAVDQ